MCFWGSVFKHIEFSRSRNPAEPTATSMPWTQISIISQSEPHHANACLGNNIQLGMPLSIHMHVCTWDWRKYGYQPVWGGTSTTTGAKLGSTPPTRGSGTTSFITQKIREGERPIMFNLAWAYVRVVGMSRKGVGIYFCVFINFACALI